jgi:hypothetical protein
MLERVAYSGFLSRLTEKTAQASEFFEKFKRALENLQKTVLIVLESNLFSSTSAEFHPRVPTKPNQDRKPSWEECNLKPTF